MHHWHSLQMNYSGYPGSFWCRGILIQKIHRYLMFYQRYMNTVY